MDFPPEPESPARCYRKLRGCEHNLCDRHWVANARSFVAPQRSPDGKIHRGACTAPTNPSSRTPVKVAKTKHANAPTVVMVMLNGPRGRCWLFRDVAAGGAGVSHSGDYRIANGDDPTATGCRPLSLSRTARRGVALMGLCPSWHSLTLPDSNEALRRRGRRIASSAAEYMRIGGYG